MSNRNVLFLFSDEHRRDALGCHGHPLVKTPNLDRLAATGTRFTQAYTTSPICVPARAAMACGQYVHETRCWSNAQAYQGQPPSWGHALQAGGMRVDSIGKLHYRGAEFDNGFDNEILPMYIRGGIGWIKGLLRNHEQVLDCSTYAREIGPGNSSYTDYDLGVTRAACDWLTETAERPQGKPWALFVSWLRPHYPLTCPPEYYDLYPLDSMDKPRYTSAGDIPTHPVLEILRQNFNYDDHFDDHTRQVARASYYGLCSFLDAQVGQVLAALQQTGLDRNTLVIYTSDHGDHNGDRGYWTKMTHFDESSGVPMILSGPGIPATHTVDTLASLVDIHPTILQAVGLEGESKLPGIPLQQLAQRPDPERKILCEYHDGGSPTGMFMLRNSRWKYNYYPGYPAELYDMIDDPGETRDLSGESEFQGVVEMCHAELRELLDPDEVNNQAFADQRAKVESLGGVQAILDSGEFDFTPVESS